MLQKRVGKKSVLVLLGTIGCAWLTPTQILPAQDAAAPAKPSAYAPAHPYPPLSPRLPYDVNVEEVRQLVNEGEIPQAQRLFDVLAWQAFVALNWPANDDGRPDWTKNMSDNTTWRVWNYWRSSGSIFLPFGAAPEPWDGKLHHTVKFQTKANAPSHTGIRDNFEAFTGPLVDQNGNWARFEIRVNKEEFDYILDNELYSQDGQAAFSHRETNNEVNLPLNGNGKHGAIEVKLAWKQLAGSDDPSRFYTTDIEVTPSEPQGYQPNPKKIHVGLVGMHIAMRTQSSPEWIWSTFEQIDNVRVNKGPDGKSIQPNFVNPNSTGPFNVLPPKNAVTGPNGFPVASSTNPTTWIESLTTTPTQVQRVDVPTQPQLNPLDKSLGIIAREVTAEVQAMLKKQNSVFQYYELIDTQWPLHPNSPAYAGGSGSAPESVRFKTPGEMVPVFLVNTTMETYFQLGEQPAGNLEQDDRLAQGNSIVDSTIINATESCVGCHYSSGITVGFKKNDDGSEVLVNGLPVPIFGENNHFGKTGNANFSWMLQQEPQAKPRRAKAAAAAAVDPKAKDQADVAALQKFLDQGSPKTSQN